MLRGGKPTQMKTDQGVHQVKGQYCQDGDSFLTNLQIQQNPNKIPAGFAYKGISKLQNSIEVHMVQNDKNNFEENKVGNLTLYDFKTSHASVTSTEWY